MKYGSRRIKYSVDELRTEGRGDLRASVGEGSKRDGVSSVERAAQTGRRPRLLRELHFNRSLY